MDIICCFNKTELIWGTQKFISSLFWITVSQKLVKASDTPGDFIRRSRRILLPAKISSDFRWRSNSPRSAYKIARCVAGFRNYCLQSFELTFYRLINAMAVFLHNIFIMRRFPCKLQLSVVALRGTLSLSSCYWAKFKVRSLFSFFGLVYSTEPSVWQPMANILLFLWPPFTVIYL